jgi:uncharacterized membrane protein YfcA
VSASTLWVTGVATLLGGLVRGAAGFGGALVMVPLLATVSVPAAAVSLVLVIESAGYVDMLRHRGREIDWRAITPLTAAAIVTVPIGVYGITHFSVPLMTRVIAVCVMASALVLMSGWRYARTPVLPVTLGVGAVSGLLEGVAGVPGPPVALFLYGGPQSARTVRDNLVGYFLVLDLLTLAAFALQGSVTREVLWLAAPSLPLSLLANWGGVRLSSVLPDAVLRRIALGLILAAGMGLLLA